MRVSPFGGCPVGTQLPPSPPLFAQRRMPFEALAKKGDNYQKFVMLIGAALRMARSKIF